MKIIEEKIWWEFTCKVCNSILEAEPEDVIYWKSSDGNVYAVECPKCGKEHCVPRKKLTYKIMNGAKKVTKI